MGEAVGQNSTESVSGERSEEMAAGSKLLCGDPDGATRGGLYEEELK